MATKRKKFLTTAVVQSETIVPNERQSRHGGILKR